jgi:hypothetical protein
MYVVSWFRGYKLYVGVEVPQNYITAGCGTHSAQNLVILTLEVNMF